MLELFTAMVKEEWRIHSTIFGSVSFALFPVLIGVIAAMGTYLLPLLTTVVPAGVLAVIVHGNFLLLGLMVGAFGLLGAEVMNRRFGQASLLAYAARSLPLSERLIFLTFVVKDTVYYFVLWVLPFIVGFALAAPLAGIPASYTPLLTVTLTASFLTGLSLVFLLSSVYVRSHRLFAAVLAVFMVTGAVAYGAAGTGIVFFFPPLILFQSFSWTALGVTVGGIVIMFAVSALLFTPEFSGVTKRYRNSFSPLAERLSVLPSPPLAAKDLIDLYRSGSAVGQTIFSFIIPLGLIWFFLSTLAGFLPVHGVFIQFALLTGVISSTMYIWLTQFDAFSAYACLPVGVRAVITGKICSFTLLQLIPVTFLSVAAAITGETAVLVPALLLSCSVSYYALAVTVYMTGLSPAVLLYDARVLFSYLVLIGLPVLLLGGLAIMNPAAGLAGLLLLVPAWLITVKGIATWDAREPQGVS